MAPGRSLVSGPQPPQPMARPPLRVVPGPASHLPGDEPVDVADEPSIAAEDYGDGRWALHDADDRDHWAVATPLGATRDGARIVEVVVAGWRFELEVLDAARADLLARATRASEALGHGGPLEVRAIIPGRIMAVSVSVGDEVAAGQQLLVVEAMKMQNELRAPRAGTVDRVVAAVGTTVELGDVLVVLG